MKYRFSLEGVPKFEELLESTASDIRRSGKAHGFLSFAGDNQIHPFELQVSNFNVEDYGAGQGPECLVCDTRRDRRFGFFITCADGVERGPIGSGCIFEHVLGDEAGKRLGRQLNTIAADASYLQKHTRLIREAGSHYNYVVSLGLNWIYDNSEFRRAKLTNHEYRKIAECKSSSTPFPKPILKKLLEHELQPPPPVKAAAPVVIEVAPPPLTETILSERERDRMLSLWGHGLAERFATARRLRTFDQMTNRFPVPLTIQAQLRQFADDVEASIEARKEATRRRIQQEEEEKLMALLSPAPLPEEEYSPTEITAAACKYLNATDNQDLRKRLMKHRTNWLSNNLPDDALFYSINRMFMDSFVERLRRTLPPLHRSQ